MFFTREDILKIQAELTKLGVKDSDFRDAHTPLDSNDILVLSQGGRNVKIRIQDFLEQLHLLSSDDFINVTTKFDAHHLSLQEAIQILPSKVRKIGLTITFQNIEGNWEIWQFTSNNIHQFNEPSAWENCKVSVDSIAIPDEEDLTMITQGTRLVTKFKDKTYDPANFSGMGRVYLRKNVTKVQDPNTKEAKTVNLLTLKMLGKENTIYIIQYDYDLNGTTITVPSGCTLDFLGGSINNGIISSISTLAVNGNGNNIGTALYNILSDNLVTFSDCKFKDVRGIAINKIVESFSTNTHLSLIILGCEFNIGLGSRAINLINSREAIISNCVFVSKSFDNTYGIYRFLTVNTNITNCLFQSLTYGIYSGDTTSDNPYCAGLILMNSTIIGCLCGIASYNEDSLVLSYNMIDFCNTPILVIGTKSVRIAGNYISNRSNSYNIEEYTQECVIILGGVVTPNDIVISDNTIVGHVDDVSNIKIQNGVCNIIISNNVISFVRKHGIEFDGEESSGSSIHIDGNIFTTQDSNLESYIYSKTGLNIHTIIRFNSASIGTPKLASLNSGRGNAKYYSNSGYYLYDTVDHFGSNRNEEYKNIGRLFFDTTLNKPIWWTGSKWVDSTGADV